MAPADEDQAILGLRHAGLKALEIAENIVVGKLHVP